MVIQRWQSVFLLLASIMMGIYSFLPLAANGHVNYYPSENIVYMVLNLLIALFSFVAIFLFKNLARQKMVVKVNAFLIVASAVTAAIMIFVNMPQMQIQWTSGPLLLVCSFLMTIVALRRINHDDKLLKAADRIR